MSSQAANVIDLRSYRERRKALQLAEAPIAAQHPVQPFPFYAPAFFFGFWPCWVMAPIPMMIGRLVGRGDL
ncbi:MAG: hypothetical protein HZA66_24910 [Rhodopseudomonas palustris]|uniref:Uncharacterized protein n=1 Tax=Rhodopseudomonas palustris TaxID=1076 RepID=A0A933S615_RHOPL|nr:hypothetical protein [Rhodopseudomonas palustris]